LADDFLFILLFFGQLMESLFSVFLVGFM